jgi:GNAT superfamily N-acetyltransferase
MTKVIDLTHSQSALPLLKELRSSLNDDIFLARLDTAIKGGYRVMGLLKNETVVGVLGYRIVHDICWGKTFYVDDLNVSPDIRGSGIGGQLIEAAKHKAREESCDHLRLCSGLTRTDAHRFYEAHDLNGFSKQFVLALTGD